MPPLVHRAIPPLALVTLVAVAGMGCRRADPPSHRSTPSNTRDRDEPAPTTASEYEPPATTGAAPGYVGETLCCSCHAEIGRTYRELGMAKAFYRPTEDNVIEDFTHNHLYHEPSDRHYEMTHRDGGFFVTRYQQDSDGVRYNAFELRITHVIGSGHHSRGYVHLTESGEMFQMPVAWYTQEARWGMAPGYDNAHHSGFSRPVSRSCMFCHNAYPDVPVGSDRFGQPDRFPRDLPEGIGCERCHGPGAEHVRAASDEASTLRRVRESIVNPARLEPRLQNDVCMQCHLQPTSKLTSIVRRFDQPDYAYRPGQPLETHLVHYEFDSGPEDADRFEIDSAAYRLQRSTCFNASGGALTCLTCHDPHRRITGPEKAAYYRERCFHCHKPEDCAMDATTAPATAVPADDCVTCHMPRRRTDDVVHVVMTDHEIQRHRLALDDPPVSPLGKGGRAPLVETPSPKETRVRFLMPDRAPAGGLGDVYLALPGVKDGMPGAIERLRDAIDAARPDAVEPYVELASAELANGLFERAEASFEHITRKAPRLALGHTNLGVARVANGRAAEAIASLRTALKLGPDMPDTHYDLGAALARTGRNDEAISQYERAIELRPTYAKCRFNLGNAYARTKRMPEAAEQFRAALAIDPDLMDGYTNLGSAQRYLGDWSGAVRTWRRGLRRFPHNGAMADKLARALLFAPDASLRDYPRASEAAVSAVRSDPSNPRHALTLAAALLLTGQYDNATRLAEQAGRMGADATDCRLIAAVAMKRSSASGAAAVYRQAIRSSEADASDGPMRRTLRRLAAECFHAAEGD